MCHTYLFSKIPRFKHNKFLPSSIFDWGQQHGRKKVSWKVKSFRLGLGKSPDMFIAFIIQPFPKFKSGRAIAPIISSPSATPLIQSKHPGRARQLQAIVNKPKYTIKSIEVSKNAKEDGRSGPYHKP